MRIWLVCLVAAGCAARPARAPRDSGDGALARWSRGEGGSAEEAPDEEVEEEDEVEEEEPEGDDFAGDLDELDAHSPFGEAPDDILGVPPDATLDYTATTVLSGGTLAGRVTWTRAPGPTAAPAQPPGCPLLGADVVAGSRGEVAGALVYLEDIGIGKPPLATGGVLSYHRCAFTPRVQIAAPIGQVVLVANEGSGKTALAWLHVDSGARHDIALGDGRHVEVPLQRAGHYHVQSDRPAPGGQSAWVIVPRHPYYAVTDGSGGFSLADIPAGSYLLAVWYPPARAGDPPTVRKRRVRIERARTTVVGVDLGRR